MTELKDNLIIPDQKRTDEKIAEILSIKGNVLRMSNLSQAEIQNIFDMYSVNKIFLKDDLRINRILNAYLNLAVSKEGKLLDIMSEIFKSDTLELPKKE